MKSNRWAAVISFSLSSLLTWGLAVTVPGGHNAFYSLVEIFVTMAGIGGMVVLWGCNFVRDNPAWAVHGWADYALYFLGNACFFVAVLWGQTRSEGERWVLFFVRLPFFLLLAPVFWLAVAFASGHIAGQDGGFSTPLRMWRGLMNWLQGAPPGYRMR